MKAAKAGRDKSGDDDGDGEAYRPKPGAIVPPLEHRQLAHELITLRGRATRLELMPLADRLRHALRWRVMRLTPLVASPAYSQLWQGDSKERRELMLDSIFASGDFHYGASSREIRQVLARWIHARLVANQAAAAAKAETKAALAEAAS